ncbi:hypothetical protein PAEPH01_0166 [Pancytospora epiphaga]|nr:hypothetical protein PAEPH01_0166 [Pancytospora epiphaga]
MDSLHRLNEKLILVPKLLYFMMAMLFYTFHQFRGAFINSQFHVSKKQLGAYFGYIQLIAFLINLWIAGFNDRTGKQRMVLAGLVVSSAIFFQTFFVIQSAAIFWIAFGFYFSLISATMPLLDKVMLDYLTANPNTSPESYGVQRVFSSIGYLVTNFIIEQICKSGPGDKDFSNMAYYNAFIGVVVTSLIVLFIRNLPPHTNSNNYLLSISKLLRNFDFMYLMFIVLLCGIVRASMTVYLGLYYIDVLRLKTDSPPMKLFWPFSYLLEFFYNHKQSTTTMFGVALEIIIFFNSARIIRKIGLFMPLLIAQFAQFARFVAYYNLHYDNSNAFLYCCLFELLKGLTFGLIQSSAAILVSRLVPPSLKTTGQIIYNGTFIALGTVLSGFIFQFVFSPGAKLSQEEAYNEFRSVFLINSFISVLIIVFFLFKYAVKENLIFNKENAEEKLRGIEERALMEEIPDISKKEPETRV